MKYTFLGRLFFAVILCIILHSCKNDIEQIRKITSKNKMPDVEVKKTEILYTDSAVLRMRTVAPKVKMYSVNIEEPYTEFPEGLKTYFYDKEGKVNASLSANYAKYFPNKKLWDAKYDVELVNVQGDVLNTEQIFFDEEKEQLYTKKYVHILVKKTGREAEGKNGFRSGIDFTDYQFYGFSSGNDTE